MARVLVRHMKSRSVQSKERNDGKQEISASGYCLLLQLLSSLVWYITLVDFYLRGKEKTKKRKRIRDVTIAKHWISWLSFPFHFTNLFFYDIYKTQTCMFMLLFSLFPFTHELLEHYWVDGWKGRQNLRWVTSSVAPPSPRGSYNNSLGLSFWVLQTFTGVKRGTG